MSASSRRCLLAYLLAVRRSLRAETTTFRQLVQAKRLLCMVGTAGDKLADNAVGNAIVFLEFCASISRNCNLEIRYCFAGR